jgi:hypothetical protein
MTAPRIPRKYDPDDGEPLPPHVEMVIMLAITAGAIASLWLSWQLWRWFVRALMN